jgi:hypothetical protein
MRADGRCGCRRGKLINIVVPGGVGGTTGVGQGREVDQIGSERSTPSTPGGWRRPDSGLM